MRVSAEELSLDLTVSGLRMLKMLPHANIIDNEFATTCKSLFVFQSSQLQMLY